MNRRSTGRGFTGALPGTIKDILSKVDLNVFSQLQGGWEGWLQVEIAAAYIQLGFTAARETHPYPDGSLRADLELSSKNTDIVVEIKCQSVGQVNFHNKVIADYNKLVTLGQQRIGVLVAVVDQTTEQSLSTSIIKSKLDPPMDLGGGWRLFVKTGVAA